MRAPRCCPVLAHRLHPPRACSAPRGELARRLRDGAIGIASAMRPQVARYSTPYFYFISIAWGFVDPEADSPRRACPPGCLWSWVGVCAGWVGGADTINGSAPNIQPMDQDDQGAGDRPGGRQGQKPGAGNSEDADDTLGYGGSEKMTSEADVLALCRNLMMRMGPGGHKRAKQAFAMRWMKNNMGVTDMDWLTMENLIRQGISIAHDEEGIIGRSPRMNGSRRGSGSQS